MTKEELKQWMPLQDVLNREIKCDCGHVHKADTEAVLIGRGALRGVPALLEERRYTTVFLLEDTNTHKAAGEKLADILQEEGVTVYGHIYECEGFLSADEAAMEAGAAAFKACPTTPDVIISVGSGALNDLGKVIGTMLGGVPQWVCATAASMDGYSSNVAACSS